MRWGQVKLILIVTLLLVNLAMLTLLVSDYQKEHYIDATYVEEAVPLLAARGVEVEVEEVPRLKCAMVTQRLTPAGTQMTAFLRALLGERGEFQPVTEYQNDYGSYQTEDYFSFSVTFAEGYPDTFRRTGEVAKFLERAIDAEEFELVQESIRRDGDHRVVRFREYARGVQIEGCYLDAMLEGGELMGVQGRLVLDTRIASPAGGTRNAVDALFDLADYLGGQRVSVASIQPVLSVYRNTWGTYNSTPVYLIRSRGGLTYRVNLDGEVSLG